VGDDKRQETGQERNSGALKNTNHSGERRVGETKIILAKGRPVLRDLGENKGLCHLTRGRFKDISDSPKNFLHLSWARKGGDS